MQVLKFFPSSDVINASKLKIFQLKQLHIEHPRDLTWWEKTSFPWSARIRPKPGNSQPCYLSNIGKNFLSLCGNTTVCWGRKWQSGWCELAFGPVWPDWAMFWTLGNFLKPLETRHRRSIIIWPSDRQISLVSFLFKRASTFLLVSFQRFLSGHTALDWSQSRY